MCGNYGGINGKSCYFIYTVQHRVRIKPPSVVVDNFQTIPRAVAVGNRVLEFIKISVNAISCRNKTEVPKIFSVAAIFNFELHQILFGSSLPAQADISISRFSFETGYLNCQQALGRGRKNKKANKSEEEDGTANCFHRQSLI